MNLYIVHAVAEREAGTDTMQLITLDEIVHDLRVEIQFTNRQHELRTKMYTKIIHIRRRHADVHFAFKIISNRQISIYVKRSVVPICLVVRICTRQADGITGVAIHRTRLCYPAYKADNKCKNDSFSHIITIGAQRHEKK